MANICFLFRKGFCNPVFWVLALQTLGLVTIYYIFSIGLTFYQKWFIKDFHYPLTVVICHLVVKFLLATIFREILECCMKTERIVLSWYLYINCLCAVGITSAIDIGLSNWSFEYITVTLYTMTKSSCIIFILLFSLCFGLEKLRCSLILIVLLISTGLFLFTYQSTQFNLPGFTMVLSASVIGGLRWTLTQLVMQKKEIGLSNPIDMIYHVQPWMILGLLPLAVGFEGLQLISDKKVFRFEDITVPLEICAKIFIGALLAFFMEVSEFLLLAFTSSLTLSLAGTFKEICAMYLAWQFNGDKMSTINLGGLFISLAGIFLHTIIKATQIQGKDSGPEQIQLHSSSKVPLLNGEFSISGEDDDDEEDIIFDAQIES